MEQSQYYTYTYIYDIPSKVEARYYIYPTKMDARYYTYIYEIPSKVDARYYISHQGGCPVLNLYTLNPIDGGCPILYIPPRWRPGTKYTYLSYPIKVDARYYISHQDGGPVLNIYIYIISHQKWRPGTNIR